MRMNKKQFIFASILLLTFANVEGEDVPVPSFGRCISQLESQGDLAVKICKAKLARAGMTPGLSKCTTSRRLINEQIRCNKSDSASPGVDSAVGFLPYHPKLNAPVSINDMASFYVGKHAGAGDRFEIAKGNDGSLKIMENDEQSGTAQICIFQLGRPRCVIDNGFSGHWQRQTRHILSYTLQLDGVLVEEEVHQRRCHQPMCSPGGCGGQCILYKPSLPTKTAWLHRWN